MGGGGAGVKDRNSKARKEGKLKQDCTIKLATAMGVLVIDLMGHLTLKNTSEDHLSRVGEEEASIHPLRYLMCIHFLGSHNKLP